MSYTTFCDVAVYFLVVSVIGVQALIKARISNSSFQGIQVFATWKFCVTLSSFYVIRNKMSKYLSIRSYILWYMFFIKLKVINFNFFDDNNLKKKSSLLFSFYFALCTKFSNLEIIHSSTKYWIVYVEAYLNVYLYVSNLYMPVY